MNTVCNAKQMNTVCHARQMNTVCHAKQMNTVCHAKPIHTLCHAKLVNGISAWLRQASIPGRGHPSLLPLAQAPGKKSTARSVPVSGVSHVSSAVDFEGG
jgi:hypothetical protein